MAIKLTPEQNEAVEKINGRICVAAGAGSGKTRVLVERMIALLAEKKAAPRQLLAVTFTNKAAGEMKERLRVRVEERLRGAASQSEKQQWETLLDELPMAVIGTIHGFCGRLLRAHPVESGRDPSFRVADEAEATLLVQEVINGTLERALRNKEPEVMQLCAMFRLRPVYNQLLALWQEKYRLPPAGAVRGEAWYRVNQQRLSGSISDCWDMLTASVTTKKQKEELERLEQQQPDMKALIGTVWQDEKAAGVLLERLQAFSASGKIKEPLKELRESLEEARSVWAEQKAERIGQTFRLLLQRVAEAVRKRQLLENVLFFDDLEREAIALLANHETVRRQWQQRFAYIMVDEFQDTNQTQLELLNLLDNEQRTGNFFFVGDAKQSIYRFRGAQVEVFRQEHDGLPDGCRLKLVKNFRSEPAVLDSVNAFFHTLYEAAGLSDFVALEPGRDVNVAAATCFYLAGPEQAGKQAEAAWIAAELKRLVGSQTVHTEGRPITYGDCALLFRSGQRMNLFAESLRLAGIPYKIVGSSGFYEQQEVQDMLLLLGVLDNRFRALELVGVLRSPLFGLTDETIFLLTEASSLWEALLAADGFAWLAGKQRALVLRAARILTTLRAALRWVSPQQLAELILTETEAAAWLASGDRGAEASANVDKLFAKMVQFCQDTGGGVSRFLAYVEQCRSVDIREELAQTDIDGAVQLMTIHKAKGLEFPVVVLPELDARFPLKPPAVLVDAEGHMGLSVRVGNEWIANWTQQQLLEKYKRDEKEEAMRVLYVAMTRAKERLLLTGQRSKKMDEVYMEKLKEKAPLEAGSWLEWLAAFWPQAVAEQEQADGGPREVAVRTAPDERALQQWREAFPLASELPAASKCATISLSASALQTYHLCPRWFYYQYRLRMPECRAHEAGDGSGASGLAARELGLLTHKVLEMVIRGRTVEQSMAEALRAMPGAEAQGQLALDMVQHFLATPAGAQLQAGKAQAEVPFVFGLPLADGCQIRFSGALDCLLPEENGQYRILDYKTTQLPDAFSAQEKAKAYEHQLMLYTLAVEAAYGEVSSASLCYLRSGETVPVAVHQERTRLLDEILSAGQAIAAGKTESAFPVVLKHCAICPFSGFCRRV